MNETSIQRKKRLAREADAPHGSESYGEMQTRVERERLTRPVRFSEMEQAMKEAFTYKDATITVHAGVLSATTIDVQCGSLDKKALTVEEFAALVYPALVMAANGEAVQVPRVGEQPAPNPIITGPSEPSNVAGPSAS